MHNPVRSELGNENIRPRNQGETSLGHYYANYTRTNLAWIQSLTDDYFTWELIFSFRYKQLLHNYSTGAVASMTIIPVLGLT